MLKDGDRFNERLKRLIEAKEREEYYTRRINGIAYYVSCIEYRPTPPDDENLVLRNEVFMLTSKCLYGRRRGWGWHSAGLKVMPRN